MSELFPSCHGIGVAPANLGLELGWLRDVPPAAVTVELVDAVERAADAELVWQLDEEPAVGHPLITSQTWEESPERIWVGNTINLALRVDHGRDVISIAAQDGNLQVTLEALASIALPLVAQRSGSLMLHASAACIDGSAVLLCAEGGSGKSSLLAGLVAAGWDALSEDQCAIDLDLGGTHRVWPGPSWVRLKRGATIPSLIAEHAPRFEAVDKFAWDITEWIAHAPAQLDRIVLLEPPGGTKPIWEPLDEPQVIGALAKHATWFQRNESFASIVLPSLVKLGMSVPGFRMRVPRRFDWLEYGVALLTAN